MKHTITNRSGFAVVILLLTLVQALGGEDTNLYYKVFAYGTLVDPLDISAPPMNGDMRVELSSKDKDITWPLGSMAVRVVYDTDYLIVRNTHLNLQRIGAAIYDETMVVRIVLESTIFAFRTKDVEALQKGRGVSRDSLFELVGNGRAELVSTARSITASGQEVSVRNTRRFLYPDDPVTGTVTNGVQEGKGSTFPEGFTAGETGSILTVVPERERDGLIGMIVKSEWSNIEKWEKHDAVIAAEGEFKKRSLKIPVIDSTVVETQLRLASGETVLLGGGKTTSGDRVMYHFLKAEVTTPEKVQQGGGGERR